MSSIIVTPRIVRDFLALKGPMGLTELTKALGGSDCCDKNIIQSHLLDLAVAGEVNYDLEKGTWESEVTL